MHIGRWGMMMAAAALLLSGGSLYAAPVTIDTFELDQSLSASGSSSANPVSVGDELEATAGNDDESNPGFVLGDHRDVFAERTTGSESLDVSVDNSNDGQYSFSAGSDARGISKVQWDGNDDDPDTLNTSGLSSIDLTDGGTNNGIATQIILSDSPVDITFTAYNSDGVESTLTKNTGGGIFSATSFDFLFEDFSNPSVFNDVTALEMHVDSTSGFDGSDLRVNLVEATSVPAPAAFPAGLVLLGGMGLICRRRRMRRAA